MLGNFKRSIKNNIARPYWNLKESFPYFGQKVYFPSNSIIFNRAVHEGIYERENLEIIKAFCKPNSTILDIGANIGLMAIPLLKSDQTIKVVSIEASPNTLPYLSKTQSLSAFKENWTIIDKAVSDKAGKISFQLAGKADGAYESILNTRRATYINVVEVDCTTIDLIWEELEKPHISFIKIDIEGADLLALKGGTNCIAANLPTILMEWNQTNIRPFGLRNWDLLELSKEINYSIFSLPTLSKISCLSDLELFGCLTENFLLIPKC